LYFPPSVPIYVGIPSSPPVLSEHGCLYLLMFSLPLNFFLLFFLWFVPSSSSAVPRRKLTSRYDILQGRQLFLPPSPFSTCFFFRFFPRSFFFCYQESRTASFILCFFATRRLFPSTYKERPHTPSRGTSNYFPPCPMNPSSIPFDLRGEEMGSIFFPPPLFPTGWVLFLLVVFRQLVHRLCFPGLPS